MSQVENNINKNLQVSESVIAGVVNNAVNEVDGVYGIADVKPNLKQLWLREENVKDIKIVKEADVFAISLGVVIKKGAKAVNVCEDIQETVKSTVQNMLGLTVTKVNVTVRGLKN